MNHNDINIQAICTALNNSAWYGISIVVFFIVQIVFDDTASINVNMILIDLVAMTNNAFP